jgi:hypothetical protein
MLIYVNDNFLISPSKELMEQDRVHLMKGLKITDLGLASYILGI